MHEEQLKQMRLEKEELIKTAPERIRVLQKKLNFDEDYAGCLLGFVNNIPLLEDGVRFEWEVPASVNEEDMICIDCGNKHHRVELKENFMNLEWILSRCNQCYESWKKESARKSKEKSIARRIEKAGISIRLLEADIKNIPLDRKIKLLEADLKNHLWLIGPNRTGKTYAAIALLKEKAKDCGIKMVRFINLFDPDINISLQRFQLCKDYSGILLLDDVAPNESTFWHDRLDAIICNRYEEMLPTIITVNESKDNMEGAFGKKVYSRIIESDQLLIFEELKTIER